MTATPAPVEDIHAARVLAVLGDSVTTDHISPAGSIKLNGPAGKYLAEHGVKPADFNSYGSRRGNHEVMVRGTFANVRLRNKLAPGTEGGVTRLLPEGDRDEHLRRQREIRRARSAAGHPRRQRIRLRIVARLGGQRAEAAGRPRRHRRKLRAHPPLEPGRHGNSAAAIPRGRIHRESLGLTGEEIYDFPGLRNLLDAKFANGRTLTVEATAPDGNKKEFQTTVRIDTPQEILYYENGGILQYVLRQLAGKN